MSASQPQAPGADPSMEDILASIRRILSEEDTPAPLPPPVTQAPAKRARKQVEPAPDVLLLDQSMLVPNATPANTSPAETQPSNIPPVDAGSGATAEIAPEPFEPISPEPADPFEAAMPEAIDAPPDPVPPAPAAEPEETEIQAVAAAFVEPVTFAPEPMPAAEHAEVPFAVPATSGRLAAPPVLFPVPHPELAGSPFPFPPDPTSVPSESLSMSAAVSSFPADATGITSPESAAAAAGSVTSLVRALTTDRATQVHSGGPTIADLVREEIRPVLKSWLDTNLPPLVERLVRAEIERVIARAAA